MLAVSPQSGRNRRPHDETDVERHCQHEPNRQDRRTDRRGNAGRSGEPDRPRNDGGNRELNHPVERDKIKIGGLHGENNFGYQPERRRCENPYRREHGAHSGDHPRKAGFADRQRQAGQHVKDVRGPQLRRQERFGRSDRPAAGPVGGYQENPVRHDRRYAREYVLDSGKFGGHAGHQRPPATNPVAGRAEHRCGGKLL